MGRLLPGQVRGLEGEAGLPGSPREGAVRVSCVLQSGPWRPESVLQPNALGCGPFTGARKLRCDLLCPG